MFRRVLSFLAVLHATLLAQALLPAVGNAVALQMLLPIRNASSSEVHRPQVWEWFRVYFALNEHIFQHEGDRLVCQE